MPTDERYDVALSFAGENRDCARALADLLIAQGINVFYDEYRQSDLWGEHLTVYLADVYENRAEYVILFLSSHYAAKVWTTHELKSALTRAVRERRAYILPIRLDDTEVPGLNPAIVHLKWPPETAETVADRLLAKLGRKRKEAPSVPTVAPADSLVAPVERKHALVNPVDGAEMVLIPAGEFVMGSKDGRDNEKPQRTVYLDAYRIYRTPVTVAQYRTFCEASKREMPNAPSWGWKDDHPIVNVSRHDATAYCAWAGMVLPTEAQWEKAARGTDARVYPWGNEWDASRCCCSRKTFGDAKSTAPVGSYPMGVSPCGCLDMAGNVWEWCADWYDKGYYKQGSTRNPVGPEQGTYRVVRGGAWNSILPVFFRAAYRFRGELDVRDYVVGFRCVSRADSY